MFAISVTFKLLSWYLALRYGDTGRPTRPWILGTLVAIVFAGFDLASGYRSPRSQTLLAAAYLVAAVVLMNVYYRIQSVALALLVGAIGTAVLFFGVPYLVNIVLE
jgi:hypothetical protein